MSIRGLIIPKEHGAWAVLLVPMIVVSCVVETFSLNLMLLAGSTLAMFMSSGPVQMILRNRLAGSLESEKLRDAKFSAGLCLLASLILATPLLLQRFWLLAAFGFLAAVSFFLSFFISKGTHKSIRSDLLAVFGLTLSAPSTYYLLQGTIDSLSLELWLLNFLFFGSSVFYVHMKIAATKFREFELNASQKLLLGKMNLVYHVVVLAIITTLVALNYTEELAIGAFAPILIHSIYGTVKLSTKVSFKRLGFLLLGQSIVFGILVTLTLRGS